MWSPTFSFCTNKIRRGRQLRQSTFCHDNNTTGEFDSGLDNRGIEGKNTVLSVFYCILGRAWLEGAHSLKIPYSTIAVNSECYGTVTLQFTFMCFNQKKYYSLKMSDYYIILLSKLGKSSFYCPNKNLLVKR